MYTVHMQSTLSTWSNFYVCVCMCAPKIVLQWLHAMSVVSLDAYIHKAQRINFVFVSFR